MCFSWHRLSLRRFSNYKLVLSPGFSITSLPGSLIQLAADGTRTTLVAAGDGLESADGLTIGSDNQIYVTTRGVGPGNGSVVRVNTGAEPVPEPASVLGILALSAAGVGSKFKGKLKQLTHKFKA